MLTGYLIRDLAGCPKYLCPHLSPSHSLRIKSHRCSVPTLGPNQQEPSLFTWGQDSTTLTRPGRLLGCSFPTITWVAKELSRQTELSRGWSLFIPKKRWGLSHSSSRETWMQFLRYFFDDKGRQERVRLFYEGWCQYEGPPALVLF